MLLVVLGYWFMLQLMLVAAILYWPDFFQNIGSLRALAKPIPMLDDMLTTMEETGVFGYVAGQHFFKGCNTLGAAAATLFAVGAVAGEAHRGTLEILLARPQSRLRILSERYFFGLAAVSVPVMLTSLTAPYLATLVDETLSYRSMTLGAVHEILFLAPIYSTAFFLSTISNQPIKIAIVVLFGTTFSFAIYMIKVVTHYSPFRLADITDYTRIDQERALDWSVCLPLLAVSVVLYGASSWCFRRRVP